MLTIHLLHKSIYKILMVNQLKIFRKCFVNLPPKALSFYWQFLHCKFRNAQENFVKIFSHQIVNVFFASFFSIRTCGFFCFNCIERIFKILKGRVLGNFISFICWGIFFYFQFHISIQVYQNRNPRLRQRPIVFYNSNNLCKYFIYFYCLNQFCIKHHNFRCL